MNHNTQTPDRPWYRHWPALYPKTIDYPDSLMFEAVGTTAAMFPNKAAVIYYGREITYNELWHGILTFSGYLEEIGVKKGDRVAIYLPNTPQFIIAYYGIMRANAVAVTIDPMLRPDGLRELLVDSGSKAVVTLTPFVLLVNQARADTPIETVIAGDFSDYLPAAPTLPVHPQIKTASDGGGDITTWKTIMAKTYHPPEIEVTAQDPALIIYTSGTTGARKGALHSHRGMVVNMVRESLWMLATSSSVHLSVLPFFHVTGMHFCMTVPLHSGGTMVVLSRWDREAAIQAAEKYRCTHWVNISTMVVDMLMVSDIDKRDLSSFILFGGGGSPMPRAIGEKLRNLGIDYMEGYGLTEAGCGTHINPPHRCKLQSIGVPVFDIDTKLIDPATGKETPPGKAGELIMRSPSVFMGYWNKPEETQKAFIEIDGKQWLRTGDLALMDEDGYFFIVDRIKRMVNRAGMKVWPAAIEGEFYKHPAIQEACIIATPDSRVGEEVKACITLKPEHVGTVTEQEIIAWAKGRFAAHEYPRVVEFINDIPKSASGKILWRKLQLREQGN